jgi:hypothetical protein
VTVRVQMVLDEVYFCKDDTKYSDFIKVGKYLD